MLGWPGNFGSAAKAAMLIRRRENKAFMSQRLGSSVRSAFREAVIGRDNGNAEPE